MATGTPADTRSMRIVHNALRRDLARLRRVLVAAEPPHDAQRKALAEHVAWMMRFLHDHHESEENGLYPLVRRDPAAAELLAAMDVEHAAVAPAAAALAAAARSYGADAHAVAGLVESLDALADVLLPHLLREEQELMPVVSSTVTRAEWDAWEQAIVAALPRRELAERGLWVLEGQTPEDVATMVAVVPPVPRWIIRNVLSRGYRRRAFRRWWEADHSPWRLRPSGSNSVTVPVTPEQVWAVVSDVTRIGKWSHECRGARWLDGATVGAVGARFSGHSRVGRVGWRRTCIVTAWEPGERFAYRTDSPLGDMSLWGFRIEPVEDGTRLTQTYRVLALPRLIDRLVWIFVRVHRDRTAALGRDLERLGSLAVEEPMLVVNVSRATDSLTSPHKDVEA